MRSSPSLRLTRAARAFLRGDRALTTSNYTTPQPNVIPQLDGLRAFAALLVVFSHTGSVGLPVIFPALAGIFGVLLFFMLSGFLMGYLYLHKPADTPAIAHYVSARIARIAPIYLLAVTLAYTVSLYLGDKFIYYIELRDYLRLMAFAGSNHVFWSIPPEIQFYVTFIATWIAIKRKFLQRYAPAVVTLAGVLLLFRPVFPGITIASHFHIFFLGVILAAYVRREGTIPMTPAVAGVIQAASIAAILIASFRIWPDQEFLNSVGWGSNGVVYGKIGLTLCFGAFLLASTVPNRFGNAVFGNPVVRRVGGYSFSLYLLHEPVLAGTRYVTTGLMPGGMQIVTGVALALILSAMCFHGFERPVQDMLRGPLAKAVQAATIAIRKMLKMPRRAALVTAE